MGGPNFCLIAGHSETGYNEEMNSCNIKQKKYKSVKYRLTTAVLLLLLSAALMVFSVKVPAFAEWYSE